MPDVGFDRSILQKPQSEWSEEEKKSVEDAVNAFKDEINTVCEKHKMVYKAILVNKPDGIVPMLNIVAYEAKDENNEA